MMDSESSSRPHRTGNSGNSSSSELFICFTSRLSSSSMKISSKSILSPGRGRDQQPLSLSNSLSRRLRTNGSIKGGGQASPMFPTGGKKRGCAFENPEPSSPKVTCIGQVRVKTKKQGKKMRTLSKRRSSGGGDLSFRKVEQSQSRDGFNQSYQSNASNNNQEGLNQRNQKWVHLPLTICEALRAFGAEFSCLFPCKSPCFSNSEREKEEKSAAAGGGGERGGSGGQSSCGAVFARWLVAVQDGGGKEREIELVVGGGEEEEERTQRRLSRHVVEEEEEEEEEEDYKWEVKDEDEEEREDEEGRVSICIPPKNALLLMRCRSDPVKMSALASRLWESPVHNHEDDDDDNDDVVDEEEEEEEEEEDYDHINEESKHINEEQVLNVEEIEVKKDELSFEEDKGCEELISIEALDEQDNPETEKQETETNLPLMEVQQAQQEEEELEIWKEEQLKIEEKQEEEVEIDQEVAREDDSDSEAILILDQEKLENELVELIQQQLEVETRTMHSVHSDLDVEEDKEEVVIMSLPIEAALEEETDEKKSTTEDQREMAPQPQQTLLEVDDEEEEKVTEEEEEEEEEEEPHSKVERESDELVNKQERESSVLPDCLLLMMCEPKLSMEVSKETWVCSTDFIRWLPERHVITKDGGDDHDEPNNKKRVSTEDSSNPSLPTHTAHHNNQHLQQPPRSSCSFPAPAAGVSMAAMIEQKLVNSVAYEPFVLTRCKSEPMRTAAKLAAPEACFWKNSKLEPHRNANFGIGAAGVGF